MVESRFFGGLEINEIAELLHVSEATVIRDWRAAKACLLEMIYRFYLLKWSWHRLIRRLVAVMAGVLSAGLMTMSSRFDSREEAEAALKALSRELGKFRLRLNPKKTTIARLPQATQDEWQESLRRSGTGRLSDNSRNMVQHFDNAFRLRESFRDEAVLMYGLGLLFRIVCPTVDVARIAQSCITQALLAEPGAAQKAFALLTFWHSNGLALDAILLTNTINKMIVRHQPSGFSSDVA